MFDKLKKLFAKAEVPAPPAPKPKRQRKPRPPKQEPPQPQLSAKELATQRGEPYVAVQQFSLVDQDIHTGEFTLDYNDKFVLNLIRAGYKRKDTDTDHEIVDRWFTDICRSVVLEQYEQNMADPQKRALGDLRVIQTRDIGDGRSEVS